MATGHSHVSLEVAGNRMPVVWPLSLTWRSDRDQNEQLKFWVKYPDRKEVLVAIFTMWDWELLVAYPPNAAPPATIFVDGKVLHTGGVLAVPEKSYLLLNPHGTIEIVSTGLVPRILYGEHFPRTEMEDLADDDGDIYEAVAALQGFRALADLTPLQAALLGRLQQMGWGN